MKILITDKENNIIVDNTDDTCKTCINQCDKQNYKVVCPISNSDERRMGIVFHKDMRLFLCSPKQSTKTSKLFDEKISMLKYSIPTILFTHELAQHNERQKYERIVHNLKTLNAQSIQTQYKFIPQQVLSDNYDSIYDYVYNEIQTNPQQATITLLRLIKNNAHMKTEFSTHEKLSMNNPILSFQEHNLRSVILNVYHSFDIDFRENNNYFRIFDDNVKVRIDYDTMRVAIYHIFSNAVKYMYPNSPLIVQVGNTDNRTIVDFIMKSLNIAENEKERIFEDGYSGINTRIKNKNGKGLGMGMIRKALALNKAEFKVINGTSIFKYKGENYSDNVFRIVFSS